ncbi:MAG: hypothetical protein DRH49_07450, partial [Candidatus Coatesbacteria bacterium]
MNPSHIYAWDAKSIILLDRKDYEGANECCDRVLELDKSNAEVWARKGM